MDEVRSRLQTTQWLLDWNRAWIAAAEVKVAVIVTVNTAMLGGLGAALGVSGSVHFSHWAMLCSLISAAFIALALLSSAMVLLPRQRVEQSSLAFFTTIAKLDCAEYTARLSKVSDTELIADWSAQIHRNAEVARDKYIWVRRAIYWSFLSIAPWFFAVGLLLKK